MHTEAQLRFVRLGRVGATSFGVAPDWAVGQVGGVLAFSALVYASIAPQLGFALEPWAVLATGVLLMTALNLTVLVHELGHAFVAYLAGARVKAVVLMPLGGATVRGAIGSDGQARLTAAAGPLANLVAAGML